MSTDSAAQSGEEQLIARYFMPLAKHPGAFGLTDDAAAITPPAGCDLVLKTDGIVGGVHFFPDDPPEMVAKKALRVNLSDLAAKGATPLGFLLTLALPEEIGDAWLAPFARGLGADVQAFGCPLLGGDTDRTGGPITISIAVIGAVPQGRMVRRAGAQAANAWSSPARSATPRLACCCDAIFPLPLAGDLRPSSATASRPAISCRSRALRLPKFSARTLRRRWTSPTAWPAISPNSAAPPASTPKSRRRAFRSPTASAPRSPGSRR